MREQQKSCRVFNRLVNDSSDFIDANKLYGNNFAVVFRNGANAKDDEFVTFVGPIWDHDMRNKMAEVMPLRTQSDNVLTSMCRGRASSRSCSRSTR
jgi:hypothetical protein